MNTFLSLIFNLPFRFDWVLTPDKSQIILSVSFNQELISLDSQLHSMATTKRDESEPDRTILHMWIVMQKSYYSLKLSNSVIFDDLIFRTSTKVGATVRQSTDFA